MEELYKKDLHDPDNHDGEITHLDITPDILECKVKRALAKRASLRTKLLEVMEFQLTFSSPVATAEFSKFAGILSAAI